MDKKKKQLLVTIILTAILLFGGRYLFVHLEKSIKDPKTMTSDPVPAVDFNVQNYDGTNTYLADFKDGKPIVLNFWASKCQPCVQEMPQFQKLYDNYKDRVHFVLVDSPGALGETKLDAKMFLEDYKYNLPVYFDVNSNARKAYNVISLPTTYVIDQNFEIVAGGRGMVTYEMVAYELDRILENE